MGNIFYCVGYCPVCETGPLGARICGACGRAWVQCDECEALWADPDRGQVPRARDSAATDTAATEFGADGLLPCPACGRSLWDAPSHWASLDELERLGWQERVVAQGAALPESTRNAEEQEQTPWARPADAGREDHRADEDRNIADRPSHKRRGKRRRR